DGFLILVDGHLVIITKKGSLHVAQATPKGYAEIARVALFEDLAWSHPSFADGRIYVRSLGELARIDIRSGAAPMASAKEMDKRLAASRFGRFLAEVATADDKKAVVDRFIESQREFPLIEGDDRLHFIYRGPAEDLAVAGDLFGARQERAMTRVAGTDLFYHTARLEPDARVNYLFIKDYEEITDPRNPRKTTTTVFTKEMEMSFSGEAMEMSWVSMPKWRTPRFLDESVAASPGRIDTQELESKLLETKHTIDVYLPAGYDESEQRYPVAYVHGGKAARELGKLPAALDHLIGTEVAPLIVVFIHAQPRGGPGKYPDMFTEELVPFIDETYRTVASAEARANVGTGFAGFAAMLCTFHKPGLVKNVGCQSAFIFDSMMPALEKAIPTAETMPVTMYLDWGKYDLRNPHEAWDLSESNRKFARFLRDKGYTYVGGEVHDGTGWSSWRNRTDALFGTLFPPTSKQKPS
ncbi:MAG: alpha/beta hydrolase-fold protein, partial [Phycisphaerae bacterium]